MVNSMLYGYDLLISDFKRLADARELSHAYLLFGPDGVGKFLFARSFAGYLERGEFGQPSETLLETHIIGASSNRLAQNDTYDIGIEAVRELERFLYQQPASCAYRIGIIRDAHRLNAFAQNALLKTLEEPPAHGLIIATASDPGALLPTISSRFLKVYMRPLPDKQILDFISKYDIIDQSTVHQCICQSGGCIGRAISFIEYYTKTRKQEAYKNQLADLAKQTALGSVRSGVAIERVVETLFECEQKHELCIQEWIELTIAHLKEDPIKHIKALGILSRAHSLLATIPVNKRLVIRCVLWDIARSNS